MFGKRAIATKAGNLSKQGAMRGRPLLCRFTIFALQDKTIAALKSLVQSQQIELRTLEQHFAASERKADSSGAALTLRFLSHH